MGVYCVTIGGAELRAIFDGEEIPCGFFKNEFVWAKDPDQAIAKARQRVVAEVARKSAITSSLSELSLSVEEVRSGLSVFNLLRKQGFIFYPVDNPDHDK